jgi:hypothetical protein
VKSHSVLEEGIVAIRFDDGVATIAPSVPQLRLKSDAAGALGLEETTTPSEESWYEKRMLRIEDVPGPASSHSCYLLTTGEQCTLEPVAGNEYTLISFVQFKNCYY